MVLNENPDGQPQQPGQIQSIGNKLVVSLCMISALIGIHSNFERLFLQKETSDQNYTPVKSILLLSIRLVEMISPGVRAGGLTMD